MVTAIHEAVHRAFSEIFSACHGGQEIHLLFRGSVSVEGSTGKKCPDSCWTTSVHITGRDAKWLIILVKAGWSEIMAKAKQDVWFWLRESEEQVKVALTVKVTRRVSIKIYCLMLDETACKSSVKSFQTMHITRNRDAPPDLGLDAYRRLFPSLKEEQRVGFYHTQRQHDGDCRSCLGLPSRVTCYDNTMRICHLQQMKLVYRL